jgi:hypothetical protein
VGCDNTENVYPVVMKGRDISIVAVSRRSYIGKSRYMYLKLQQISLKPVVKYVSATMIYVMWGEEHLCNVSVLQRVHRSNLAYTGAYSQRR